MESIELTNIKKNDIIYEEKKYNEANIITNLLKNKIFQLKIFCSIFISIFFFNFFVFNNSKNYRYLLPKYFTKNDTINKAENIIKESFEFQKDFCDNPSKYLNKQYENIITLTDFGFRNINYQFYVYKKGDIHMSNFIMKVKGYEKQELTNYYNALEYYRKTRNILNKKDVYMLDLGGNIGVFPTYFGKLGYSIISFEASPRNYYILKKNYCNVNRNNENIILINRGVSNQEKICNYYTQITGIGNGMLKCDDNRESFNNAGFHWIKTFEVPIVKLSNFIPYLSKKHLALIKLDIEGSEALVMQDAIEFVTKLHIPFIYSEFSINMIKEHGNNPREYIKLFTNNGYKVSKKGFFSKKFISPDKVGHGNLYFTYYGN